MLCAGSALSYLASFLGYAMTALHRYRIQVPIGLCVVLITLISCYWFTRYFGLMGTAIGIFIGNLTQLLMCAAVVWPTARRDSKHTATSFCEATETVKTES
jgi:O-antigen/teichoic acid export membrane protein